MAALSSAVALEEQALIDEITNKAKQKEKTTTEEKRTTIPELDNFLQYTTSYEAIIKWIDEWKEREKKREAIIIKEGKEAANADLPPITTSRLLHCLCVVIRQLQKFIKSEGGANGGGGHVFPHPVITMDNVVDFWIYADSDRRQAHIMQQLSVAEYLWLAAVHGYAAKNPKEINQASVGLPHSIIGTYSQVLSQWLYWPLKSEHPTPAMLQEMNRVITAYTVYVINQPFKNISITMESATMKKYIMDREREIEADTKKEADFKKAQDEDDDHDEEEEEKEKKRAPQKKKKKKQPEQPLEEKKTDKAKSTREIILQRTNTLLAENFRDWRMYCPMISISMHVCYNHLLNLHGPHTVMYPYMHHELDSFQTCKRKLKEFLESKITFPMVEATKRDTRELIYEMSLPFGAMELEKRVPEMGEDTEYVGLFQALHKKGTASIIGHRLKTTLQRVSKVAAKEDIEKMIVPAIWLAMYKHWIEQHVKNCNWAATTLITPSRLREALKKNILRKTTRHGNDRRPMVVVIGPSFYVHTHLRKGAAVVSRLIQGDDVFDALAIWTHLMMTDEYEGKMDNDIRIDTRWLSKFR